MAKRKIAEVLPLIDAVIELIDARLPVSSRNPDFKEIFKNKPALVIFTKASLADAKETERFTDEFSRQGIPCLQLDCKKNPDMKRVTAEIKKLVAGKLQRNEEKGVVKPVRCIVAGITNVGKSTFINTYTKTKKAKAEDRPGVTRQNFWINSPYGVELLDTPGLLWHKFDDRQVGIKLAAIGSVRDEILDINTLACDTIGLIRKKYMPFIEARYKIKTEEDETNINILEKIGKSRGFLVSGGEIDLDRASVIFLDEFRAGKIGRMTLD
ncbi:ribosome biogenesis GTPase YlqF [bacterium]|nr:ribosome biogenesis GTPase YlqF [bacterium]